MFFLNVGVGGRHREGEVKTFQQHSSMFSLGVCHQWIERDVRLWDNSPPLLSMLVEESAVDVTSSESKIEN